MHKSPFVSIGSYPLLSKNFFPHIGHFVAILDDIKTLTNVSKIIYKEWKQVVHEEISALKRN